MYFFIGFFLEKIRIDLLNEMSYTKRPKYKFLNALLNSRYGYVRRIFKLIVTSRKNN